MLRVLHDAAAKLNRLLAELDPDRLAYVKPLSEVTSSNQLPVQH